MQVEFKKVTKKYGQQAALDNISLSFPENRTTAVIGPSGSGKSTLLQHINGLIKPDHGEIWVFGEPIDYSQLSEMRLKIGYAVQGSGLFPHLTVAENINLLAKLQNWPQNKLDDRLEELMRLVDLPVGYKTKYPHQISGGEQQRVGLCRAIMLNPPLFLLDEPFGALDPVTRSEVHQEVLKLQKLHPRTIILVTHDLREALKLADNIVILNYGRIVQQGEPTAIMQSPANDFVEHFVHAQLSDSVVKGETSDVKRERI